MARKKIFDIVPPGKPISEASQPLKEEKKTLLIKKTKELGIKRKKPVLITIGAIVIVGGLGWYFLEPKLTIEIWPKIERKEFKTEAPVVLAGSEKTFIPGEVFQIEKSLSQDFAATGIKLKEEKARGTIRIYNNYSAYSQPLVATTRFVSDDGKLFRTPKAVVVPGAPGTIDIEVVADQAGPEYNINPSTFSIPGFAGTPKYTAFYAKSFEPMTGGVKKEVSQVVQEDLGQAREIVTAKILEQSQISLENSVPSADHIIIEEALSQKIIEFKCLAEAGQELGKFTCQAKATAKALTFKKSALEAFVRNYISSQIPAGKELDTTSLQIKYYPQSIDLDKGKISLSLEISANIYSGFDEASLKEMMRNKEPEDIKLLLKDFPEIERAKVELWPFWVSKSPEDLERINIKLRLD